jgi:hypothetical protein
VDITILENAIQQLVSDFYVRPHDFFHEQELHTHFYGLCREKLGTEVTSDHCEVSLFRHEYETIWRYSRKKNKYGKRYDQGRGTKAGTFDFAILSREFVKTNSYLTVVNKDEDRRANLRTTHARDRCSPAIDIGIEFKMAHLAKSLRVRRGDVNKLSEGMLIDARKLAHERVKLGYLLGFSHGPLPSNEQAEEITKTCRAEFETISPEGQLRILLASPDVSTTDPLRTWCVEMPAAPMAVLEEPIKFLELSKASRKCMVRLGLSSVGELVLKTERDLLQCKGGSAEIVDEIHHALARHHLKLLAS